MPQKSDYDMPHSPALLFTTDAVLPVTESATHPSAWRWYTAVSYTKCTERATTAHDRLWFASTLTPVGELSYVSHRRYSPHFFRLFACKLYVANVPICELDVRASI
ncbi:Piso0_000066 [Millerozyma farinosa CBS 7064]|uniref:Piso0_000066 protein n=1 Tax=Pichia sorbitophila (strain ATCC MYA-4447 / BCRC 22081 / CBS 7064 / NBRC 10061 / NRRL Y-12695) TaxID=559304 RepID=G8YUF5_PICSO|nr:Piso0_000066 [Millerozyma farinosa CBS 7064]